MTTNTYIIEYFNGDQPAKIWAYEVKHIDRGIEAKVQTKKGDTQLFFITYEALTSVVKLPDEQVKTD